MIEFSTLKHRTSTPAIRGFMRCITIAALLAASQAILPAQTLAPADPGRYLEDIKTLSAPNMEGRGDGSRGLTRARDILVKRYARLGLEAKGTEGFLQSFDIITGAELI